MSMVLKLGEWFVAERPRGFSVYRLGGSAEIEGIEKRGTYSTAAEANLRADELNRPPLKWSIRTSISGRWLDADRELTQAEAEAAVKLLNGEPA